MTGQSMQDLLEGEHLFGPGYVNELVKKALDEKKKIVWIPELTDGEDLAQGKYVLKPLDAS